MAVLRASLRKIFSHRLVSWSPLIPNYLSFHNPSPPPFLSLSLSAFLSTAQDPSSDSSHNTDFRWKPMCLYHTQGKCTQMDDPIHLKRFNHDFFREIQLNIVELSKIRSQNLDFFLVLALGDMVEIIEFPVLLINAKAMEVEDIFHRFVRPSKLRKERINKYIERQYGKLGVDSANCPFYKIVPRQCEVSKIKLPSYFMEWINLRDVYTNFYNRKELQIPSLGSQRLGIIRAKIIARIMQHMLVDGALMQITARRNPNSPGDIEFLHEKIRLVDFSCECVISSMVKFKCHVTLFLLLINE